MSGRGDVRFVHRSMYDPVTDAAMPLHTRRVAPRSGAGPRQGYGPGETRARSEPFASTMPL